MQTIAYLGFAVLALGKTVAGWPIGWMAIWLGLAVVLVPAGIPNVTGRRSRD